MSNIFNSYSSLSTLTDTTILPVVDSATGQNKKITGIALKNYIGTVMGPTGATGASGFIGSNGVDGATGATGPTGNAGATGPAGTNGATGATGTAGQNGAQGSTGATGPKGADGTSVKILGSTGAGSDLPVSYGGSIGDGYLTSNGHLWIWNGTAWQDVGIIQGPQGSTGATGPTSTVPGPSGATGATGTLIPATTSTLGGVIVGHNLTVDSTGTLAVISGVPSDTPPSNNPQQGDLWWNSILGRGFIYFQGTWVEYSPQALPGSATTSSLGLVQIGNGINVTGGIISVNPTLVQSTSTPSPNTSTVWYNSGVGRSYVYNGSGWVDMVQGDLTQYVKVTDLLAIVSTSTSWTQFQTQIAAFYGS